MPVRLTRSVKVLSVLCLVMFLIQQTSDQFLGGNVLGWLGLSPYGFAVQHRFWQLFTYPFLHGDVMHLVLNLMMFVFIGGEIEAAWGTSRFLRFFFFCSTSAGILYLLLQMGWGAEGLHAPMVGASGAIYGLLMAYGLIFGERVLLFMMLFPLKAKHFVWILAGVEFFSTIFSGRGGLASGAHLGGMVAGFLYLWIQATYLVAKRRRANSPKSARPKKRKSNQHLKLVINNEKDLKAHEDPDDDDADHSPKTWH